MFLWPRSGRHSWCNTPRDLYKTISYHNFMYNKHLFKIDWILKLCNIPVGKKMSAVLFSISIILLHISLRLCSAWSHWHSLMNGFISKKVKRGEMQTQSLQNKRWVGIFILHTAEWASGWETDGYLWRNSSESPQNYYSSFPEVACCISC